MRCSPGLRALAVAFAASLLLLSGAPRAAAAPARVPRAQPRMAPLSPALRSVARLAARRLSRWKVMEADLLLHLLEVTAPGHPEVAEVRARFLYLMGRYDEAVSLLRRTNPTSAARGMIEVVHRVTRDFATHRTPSGHFVIRYPRGLESILVPYAAQVLERARSAMRSELGLVPNWPVHVEILRGPEELAMVSPLTLDDIRRTGTTGLSRDRRILIATPRSLVTGYGWQDTLAHEYVHYLLEETARGRVPLWVHEGFARFLQERWRKPLPSTLTPLETHRLATGLKTTGLVPIERMMPSFAKLKDHREAALAYAQVGSMMLYLHRQHGSAGFRRLVAGLRAGRGTDGALGEVTGYGLKPFVARWKASLRARRLRPVKAFEPRDLQYKSAPKPLAEKVSRRRTPFERYRRLGAMLRSRGRRVAAAVEYRKALAEVEGADGETANVLARVLLRLGRRAEALGVVERALPYSDHVAALHVAAARAAELLRKPGQAERHLWRAIGVDPFDPELHCRLAPLLSKRGDTAGALRETTACTRLKAEQ